MEISEETQLYPWLLIQDDTDKRKLISYDVSKKLYYEKTIPDIENKEIRSCSYGWFILKDFALKGGYCLFNPITSEMIQLPPLPEDDPEDYHEDGSEDDDYRLDSYLYLSPTDQNCRVIFFDKRNKIIFFCKPKDGEFIQQELELFRGFTKFGEKGYCISSDNGRCYYATVTFEGSQILFERLPVKRPSLAHHCYYGGEWFRDYLVESCGELLLVHQLYLCSRELYDIVVFRLDFEENKWMEIENIGSSTIFITSKRAAIACNTQQVQKNLVYFFDIGERFFNTFNIENRGFSMTLPCPIAAQESILHWIITDGLNPI